MTVIPSSHVDLLAQIELEKSRNANKWTTETTNVRVNPNLMLDLEKQDSDSPIHSLLQWKQIHTLPKLRDCLEDFCRTLTDSENPEKKAALEKQLLEHIGNVPNNDTFSPHEGDGTQKTVSSSQMIHHLYERIFHNRVKIQRHKEFPEELFLVDLSFMPEGFFYDDGHEQFSRYYKACLAGDSSIAPKMKTSHMRFCNFSSGDLGRQLHQNFTFPGGQRRTEYIQMIFTELLQTYSGMPGHSVFEWACSLLFTIEEHQQDPHVDYTHSAMRRNEQLQSRQQPVMRGRKRKAPTEEKPKESKDLPWSLDMPLQKGGLRLAFYGCDGDTLVETPVVIHVPFRHALFWRGDCVHAGCLADLLGGHGFRMHAYLPLHEGHRPMMLTTVPEIEWDDEKGQRFTGRLRRYDGTPFPKGNEKV